VTKISGRVSPLVIVNAVDNPETPAPTMIVSYTLSLSSSSDPADARTDGFALALVLLDLLNRACSGELFLSAFNPILPLLKGEDIKDIDILLISFQHAELRSFVLSFSREDLLYIYL